MPHFLEIFRFECAWRLRRVSTWASLAILGLLAFHAATGMLVEEARRAGDLLANGPAPIAVVNAIVSMFAILIVAPLFNDAALRDFETRMYPLMATTPAGKRAYLLGRFLGAFAAGAVLLAVVPLVLSAVLRAPLVDGSLLGPVRAGAFVRPYLFFLLPNLFFSGAVLFSLSILTRRSLPAYGAGVLLFFGSTIVEEVVAEQLGYGTLGVLLEPFGFTALSEQHELWTVFEKNTRLVALEGPLLWNRLLWAGVGMLLLFVAVRRFRESPDVGRASARLPREGRAEARPALPPVTTSFNARHQALAIAARSLRDLVLTREFAAIAVVLTALIVAMGFPVLTDNYGSRFWPLTQLVAPLLGSFLPELTISLLIVFYAGELVWRERDARINELADTSPVTDGAVLAGKLLALAGVVFALHAITLAAGMLLQSISGYFRFELPLYARIAGLQFIDSLLLAALAMAIHAVVGNKAAGHTLGGLAYLFTVFAPYAGVEHKLLVYGRDPGFTYSDLSGFGPSLAPLLWFKLYWGAWAVLLVVIAALFWRRGEDGFARSRFTRRVAATALGALAVALLAGGYIFYNTNVLNEYVPRDEATNRDAEYERRYGRFEGAPQPVVTATKLHVEIFPDSRTVEVRGRYALVNRTHANISDVHLFLNPEVEHRAVTLSRAAELAISDLRLGHRTYTLMQPLAPGESLALDFDVGFRPRGFPNGESNTSVVRNGTYFDHTGGRSPNHRRWLPLVGYQPDRELSTARVREAHGLPPRNPAPPIDDAAARANSAGRESIALEIVVGTSADQIGVAPGTLRGTWTANGRRYFHYAAERPVKNAYAVFSADYAVHEELWNGVRLQIFHHPSHTFNVPRIARAMRVSLDAYTKSFGPYPHRELRIVEFPRYGHFAHAYPGTISFAEGFGFLTNVDEEQRFDTPTAVVAHEVAHQWWGFQIVPAAVEGGAVLAEVLAQYSALMVVERIHGPEMVQRFLDQTRVEYLNRRGTPQHPEVPLFRAAEQPNLVYRKGPLAMWALRGLIGEERVNAALRSFFRKHASPGPPYPTTRDLYAELKQVTPGSLHHTLDDLFQEITLWTLRTTAASAERLPDGRWRATLDVEARKVRADGAGREREVAMNDLVDIGVFGADGKPLYLRKHHIRSGMQRIAVIVPAKPARAAVDPDTRLIDRDWEDNGRAIR